jgi:FtsZ-binding cell division protein ZapB
MQVTKAQAEKATYLSKQLQKYKEALQVMKQGSPQHQIAKERMLYLLVAEQESVAKALIRKAKMGDVRAISEFFDRLYGKSKETVDFNQNVQFSLKELAEKRRLLQEKAREVFNQPENTEEKITDVIILENQNGITR